MTDQSAAPRILIVEDEALVAMLVEDVAIEAGCIVTGVADRTAEALELARSDPPDLVLCDIKLAGGDSGFDVASALKDSHTACLFLSGNPPSADVGAPMALGCLIKPFRADALKDAIGIALALRDGARPDRLPGGMKLYR